MAGRTPRCRIFLRLEHNQWDFALHGRRAYDVAIVNSRYASPYPPGHPSFGQPHDRLAVAVRTAERDLLFDPGTPALMSRAITRHRSAARLRATPAAQAVELPLSVEQLRSRRVRDAFVDACLLGQSASGLSVPPYLDFASIASEKFEINLKMIERVLAVAGASRSIAFVQLTATKLRDGVLAEASQPIAETGLEQVILRVRDIGEEAVGDDFEGLLDAMDAFVGAGVEVIVDCAGRLGPLLVHEGAVGFSTGPMHFRKVAQALLSVGGGGGGNPLRYEEYGAWRWVDRGEIGKSALNCPVPGCQVRVGADLDDIREHNLHVLRHLARAAVEWDTSDLIVSLRASETEAAVEWANVLARRLSSGREDANQSRG